MQAQGASARIPIDPKLYKAAREGNINLLDSHLQTDNSTGNGGSLLGVTHSGDTALHIAAYFGHLEVAVRICDANRSLLLRANNKSETPLHYGAQAGKHEVVAHFLQAAQGLQQLQDDLQPEDINVVRELLRRRNRDGETALYQAVHNNCSAVVNILINADPRLASIPNNSNASPLYVAAIWCSSDLVTSLIDHLRDTTSAEAYAGPSGQTALHPAAFVRIDIVQKILTWKPDLAKAKDDKGSTPLHYAASFNNACAVQSLLENDKTPAYIADSDGLFPIHIAAKLGNLEVVSQIFELCPDSDELLDARDRNFLHTAVEKRQESIVRWARKNSRIDRSINAKDDEGNTPMHLAVKAKHLAIFALLLESKALHLGIMNKKGLTPLDVAAVQNTHSIFSLLSRETIIRGTLMGIRSLEGMKREDHFIDEYKLEEVKTMEREAENFYDIAKSTSTVSVLIASASFAGFFTVSGGNQSSGLNLAFKAFMLTVAYAFICSITATGLSMFATMTYVDPMDRHKSLLGSVRMVHLAIRGLILAFAFGAYVILIPASKWLAILICLTVGVVPILINPMPRANFIILRALVRSIGWKELWRRGGQRRYYLLFPWIFYFVGYLYLGFIIILIVMLCSLFEITHHFVVLISVIVVPLFLSILATLNLLFFHVSS